MTFLSVDLTQITIGEAFKSIIIVIAIIFVLWEVYLKIRNMFMTAHKKQNETEDFHELVDKHENEITQIKESQYAIVLGVQAILKNNLKELHKEYMIRESISTDEFDNFKTQYEAYHGCGGNGTGTRYYEDICKKPIVD